MNVIIKSLPGSRRDNTGMSPSHEIHKGGQIIGYLYKGRGFYRIKINDKHYENAPWYLSTIEEVTTYLNGRQI